MAITLALICPRCPAWVYEPEGLQALARWPIFWLGLGCDCSSCLRAACLGAGTHLSTLSSILCLHL